MPNIDPNSIEPLGPWTRQHSLGATLVVLIALALVVTAWPGWPQIGQWLGVAP